MLFMTSNALNWMLQTITVLYTQNIEILENEIWLALSLRAVGAMD